MLLSVPGMYVYADVCVRLSVFFFIRGRVIPADLEAKVVDAKRKVSLCKYHGT